MISRLQTQERELAAGGQSEELALVREQLRDARMTLRGLEPHRVTWRQLGRVSWDAVERTVCGLRESGTNGTRRAWMTAAAAQGLARLTPRQREIFCLRVQEGLSAGQIAQKLGVDRSTVSKTLARAQEKLRQYAENRQTVCGMLRPDGSLDPACLDRAAGLLTDRQRQVLLLAAQGRRGIEIAAELGIHPATVTRLRQKGEQTLHQLGAEVQNRAEERRARDTALRREAVDWQNTVRDLAAEYGVAASTAYHIIGRRRVQGRTALQHAVWKMEQEGRPIREIAEVLGCSTSAVYAIRRRARRSAEVSAQ